MFDGVLFDVVVYCCLVLFVVVCVCCLWLVVVVVLLFGVSFSFVLSLCL